jgi:hypothetical protein
MLSNRMRVFAATLAFLGMEGCVSNAQPRLEQEAHRLLRPGMTLVEAEQVLEGARFTCAHEIEGFVATCTRMRRYAVVATCVQRINLAADESGRTVSRFDVPQPACASF